MRSPPTRPRQMTLMTMRRTLATVPTINADARAQRTRLDHQLTHHDNPLHEDRT